MLLHSLMKEIPNCGLSCIPWVAVGLIDNMDFVSYNCNPDLNFNVIIPMDT